MKLTKAKYEILTPLDRNKILKNIEIAGRTCYKSEDRITEDSASRFVKVLVSNHHLSVIEHEGMTVRFTVDRGVSHELVRHRPASFSQESTRYCNYKGELEFIIPCWININEGSGDWTDFVNDDIDDASDLIWCMAMESAEDAYNMLVGKGLKPEQARSVLPNSLKTEVVMTANLREWKEVFRQRTASSAHPQVREVMCPLFKEMKEVLPEIFND